MEFVFNSRARILSLIAGIGIAILVLHSFTAGIPAELAAAVFTECADGIDNDHDSLIDYPQDPQCLSLHDDSEGPTGRGLFVSLTDTKSTVTPGGSLIYLLGLRSEREEPMLVDVYFQMPHQTNLISVSDAGSRFEELVVWKNVSVYPGRLRLLKVNINVNPHADDNLLLVAEAVSEGSKATDTTRVEENDQTKQIPQLKISVTDGKKYAQPGETLEYHVAVRNPTNKERTYTLRLQKPTDTQVEFVSGKNHRANRQAITWLDQVIGPKGAREYKVVVRIDEDAEEFFMIRTRASIGASLATDTTTVHTGILPTAIIVTTTDGLDQVVPGALVTYNIALQNTTNQLATEIDVNNALPDYFEFVDASEGGYWTGKNVRWEGLTVAPHGNRSLRVTGRVRSDVTLGQRLQNRVQVKGFEAVDTTVVGEQITGAGLAQARDVLISKRADRSEVRPGGSIGYTISVRNTTNHSLFNVKVEDRMDSPYVHVTNAQYGQTDGNRITWIIPKLAPGQNWDVSYTAQIDYRAPHGVSIPNVVTVSGKGMSTIALTDRIHTMQIGVISTLPPTGAAFDALFLGLTGILGAAQTLWQRRKYLNA